MEEALTTSITTHSGNAATGGIFDDDFDDEEGDDISHREDFYLYHVLKPVAFQSKRFVRFPEPPVSPIQRTGTGVDVHLCQVPGARPTKLK